MKYIFRKKNKSAEIIVNLKNNTVKKIRSGIDRRSGEDQRNKYDLDHFEKGGSERRKAIIRRKLETEQRRGWTRINKWVSVFISKDQDKEF